MLDKLRKFLNEKIAQCEGCKNDYLLRLIEIEAFGACNFATYVTLDEEAIRMWRDEYKPQFDSFQAQLRC